MTKGCRYSGEGDDDIDSREDDVADRGESPRGDAAMSPRPRVFKLKGTRGTETLGGYGGAGPYANGGYPTPEYGDGPSNT